MRQINGRVHVEPGCQLDSMDAGPLGGVMASIPDRAGRDRVVAGVPGPSREQRVAHEHDWRALEADACLLYPTDAADEGLGVALGGRRLIKKTQIPRITDNLVR